jgi:hypothetical protein
MNQQRLDPSGSALPEPGFEPMEPGKRVAELFGVIA